jgi:hypothetical protein
LLVIEYDPTRLLSENPTSSPVTEIVCHVRFQPTGEDHSGPVRFVSTVPAAAQAAARPGRYEIRVPDDATSVELWFERRGPTGSTGWDSRYGQNYRFPVTAGGLPVPEESVVLRAHAIIDPNWIHVVEDVASKGKTSTGPSGFTLGTQLRVSVQLRRAAAPVTAWADVHVFDATNELIQAGTIALEGLEPGSADTTLQTWSANIYQGSGGGSGGGMWARPDAHSVQYRLYCQVGDRVFTDGVLHQFDVPPDAEVRPIPGSW